MSPGRREDKRAISSINSALHESGSVTTIGGVNLIALI